MVKFNRDQKELLEHYIINTLTCPEAARMMKEICKDVNSDGISISKEDAISIIDSLSNIRQFVLDLPRNDDYE